MIDLKELSNPDWSEVEYLGIATLKDYQMIFKVLPDIEPAQGRSVSGLLFHIDRDLVHLLNNDMECPDLYTKRYIDVWCNGLIRTVFYTQKFTKQLMKHSPPPEYLANLYQLYLKYGLPLSQINDAMALTTKQN